MDREEIEAPISVSNERKPIIELLPPQQPKRKEEGEQTLLDDIVFHLEQLQKKKNRNSKKNKNKNKNQKKENDSIYSLLSKREKEQILEWLNEGDNLSVYFFTDLANYIIQYLGKDEEVMILK